MTDLERQTLYNEIMDRLTAKIEKETDSDTVGKLNEILYTALSIIACMPTTDAVPIVRCEDCVHYNITYCEKTKAPIFNKCNGLNCYMPTYGFCICGERKEDER